MAVKKVQKAEDVKVETPVVDETPEVTVPENVKVETPEENEKETTAPEQETPEVDVTVPDVEEPEVSVDTSSVDDSKKPENMVKVRMRTDHKCTIGGELYQLESGKVYTVPENVKRILNKAGLLSPL